VPDIVGGMPIEIFREFDHKILSHVLLPEVMLKFVVKAASLAATVTVVNVEVVFVPFVIGQIFLALNDADIWSAAHEMEVNHVSHFAGRETFEHLGGELAVQDAGVVIS